MKALLRWIADGTREEEDRSGDERKAEERRGRMSMMLDRIKRYLEDKYPHR